LKSLVLFNNKGGVGKTTLACNLAAYLNSHTNRRTLLIDADPQCNATQAILQDDLSERIYLTEPNKHTTLYDYLSPLEYGEPTIATHLSPLRSSTNRFGTDLIPGHPRLSIVEDRLSDAWSDLRGAKIEGYRITNWCLQLLDSVHDTYDIVLFDVGPSLGALNRTVILSSDYILTPFGCDIFSLLGIRNISKWITEWNTHYDRAIAAARHDFPEILDRFPIVSNISDKFRFAGYSVQQYVTRTFKTGRRAVRSYDRIMREIPDTVLDSMRFLVPERLPLDRLELGHIPYLFSLVPMAQSAKSPIHELTSRDGLVGSQYAQVKKYQGLMASLTAKLLLNMGI
jgi:cellulose biosynthesis protein BcsQ